MCDFTFFWYYFLKKKTRSYVILHNRVLLPVLLCECIELFIFVKYKNFKCSLTTPPSPGWLFGIIILWIWRIFSFFLHIIVHRLFFNSKYMKSNKTILFIPDPLGRPRRSILHEIEQNNQRGGNKEEGEGVEANNKNNTWHTETCFIWREKNSEKKSPHTTVLPYVSC